MLCEKKRPFRLSDSVTKFPRIRENDGKMEMDSLEASGSSSGSNSNQSTETGDEDDASVQLSHLNLNALCKSKEELNHCYVDEIVLPGESLQSLTDLKALSLRSNGIQNFPNSILQLTTLVNLDLSDNSLLTLPPEISILENLQELVLDQNLLSILPTTLWDLKFLRTLRVARNRLALPPDKTMRALILSESELKPENSSKINGLTTLNLRSNRLKGNIILGNYGNLTELDVSENTIENLDLSAVEQLQTLQCSRNSITQLTLHGKNLTSLIAGNNKLKLLSAVHVPLSLKHLDVSYNELEVLPEWLSGCSELRSLFASNNAITALPEHLFCNEMPFLHTLQIAYNQLQYLPIIQRRLPIQELFLQNNSLSSLPENFFKFVPNIRVLNLSNNRLCDLPRPEEHLQLEKLFLTANCLIDASLERIAPYLGNLKTLHAAYNGFTSLPEDCALYWVELEELVFSGNKLLRLPEKIGSLRHLMVLRVHSNLLQSIPKLSHLGSLRVLDLAHNQLDRVDLSSLIPPNLKFLDLSCNTKLHVDSQQFNTYRTQRPMSLVDVSGKNRTSLPLTPSPFCELNDLTEYSWSVGFSETSGCKQKLYISQIRLPAFCNTEGLFGMFDGENNNNVPFGVDKVVPRILLEERTVKETAAEYMKYTMLSAHREMRDKGQKQGLNAIICHILKMKQSIEYSFCGSTKKFIMKIASVGDIRVVLGRAAGPVKLLPAKQRKPLRATPHIQLMIPDPDVTDICLDDQDEFMIIANKNLWEVISPENAIREVTLQRNVILAAKRLQDLAQSYGAEENLSIIVVKFNLLGTDVDQLMKELRQTIRKTKSYQSESGNSASSCQPGCCCEQLNTECVSCLEKIPPPLLMNDDRSSPSGQSEHACSDCNSSAKLFVNQLNKHNETRSVRGVTPSIFESIECKSNPERRSYRGVARALRARREEEKNQQNGDSDSALSEEQFKCWEYMLEQNTQLLFDKELNTLTRNMTRKPPFGYKNPTLSRSNPHLSETPNNNSSTGSFLSRQFGSTRSFNPTPARSTSRYGLDKKQLLGGPHAAYFGSLQRLMPYNLEYDFAVMHERGLADSVDLDRMQQYWGVATTEL